MASSYMPLPVVGNESVQVLSFAFGRRKAGIVEVTGIQAEYKCESPRGEREFSKRLRGLKGKYDSSRRSFCFETSSVEKIIRKFGEEAVKDLIEMILPKIQARLFRLR